MGTTLCFLFEPHNFGIQLLPRVDTLVGWIQPAGRQLMITALVNAKTSSSRSFTFLL